MERPICDAGNTALRNSAGPRYSRAQTIATWGLVLYHGCGHSQSIASVLVLHRRSERKKKKARLYVHTEIQTRHCGVACAAGLDGSLVGRCASTFRSDHMQKKDTYDGEAGASPGERLSYPLIHFITNPMFVQFSATS